MLARKLIDRESVNDRNGPTPNITLSQFKPGARLIRPDTNSGDRRPDRVYAVIADILLA
jgi:hypothetical protein